LVTICIVPLGFYAVFVSLVLAEAKYEDLQIRLKRNEADKYQAIGDSLLQAIGYLALSCNLISCSILALVLRLSH